MSRAAKTPKAPVVRIQLQLLDVDAKSGAMMLLADDVFTAIGSWADGRFVYPCNTDIEFTPRYYRPLGSLILPSVVRP